MTKIYWFNLNLNILEIYALINIVSNKYLILILLFLFYLCYHNISDKILYSTYTSDNYKDIHLIKFTKIFLNQSKFSILILNNKILHPITIFFQNM